MIHHIHYRRCKVCNRILGFSLCLTEGGYGNEKIFKNEGTQHDILSDHKSAESVMVDIHE